MAKKRRKSNKGTPYEREVCRLLSAWWSRGHRDDLFWRIPGSGGRATRRGQAGKKTAGQCGDIEATHPRALPFLKVFTVEIKRGYSKTSPFDLIDKPVRFAHQEFEKWIIQSRKAAKYAGSRFFMIISRRDQRCAVVTFPKRFLSKLAAIDADSAYRILAIIPSFEMVVPVTDGELTTDYHLLTVPLESFCAALSPRDVLALLGSKP